MIPHQLLKGASTSAIEAHSDQQKSGPPQETGPRGPCFLLIQTFAPRLSLVLLLIVVGIKRRACSSFGTSLRHIDIIIDMQPQIVYIYRPAAELSVHGGPADAQAVSEPGPREPFP